MLTIMPWQRAYRSQRSEAQTDFGNPTGTLPTPPPADAAQTSTDGQDEPTDDYGQPSASLAGRSSNKHTLVHLARAYSNRCDLLERLQEALGKVEARPYSSRGRRGR